MTEIARLKITLDEVEPRVLRRIEAPLAIRLDDLHLVMQAVMGWENCHLYEFRVGRAAWGIPDPDWDFPGTSPRSAEDATLADLLKAARGKTKSFCYVYDFGDDWLHTVKVEAVTAAEPGVAYPRLLEAQGRCPPEDVGGPWGYADYLEAIGDPKHERHAELIQWRGPGFDPAVVGEIEIRRELGRVVRRLARRKGKRKAMD